MRVWVALAAALVGAAALVVLVGRGDGTTPQDDAAADVIGGLVTLLDDDPLDCLGDAPLPPPRRVDGDDMDDLTDRTAELRDLEFTEPVDYELLDRAEMAGLIRERFGGYSREDAELDRRVLSALGAVPASTDLRTLRVDVFAEQVSGLYTGSDGTVWVRVGDPAALRPLEQIVAVHELQHAVADQQLGRPRDVREDGEDADQRRASMAVVEGDAALTMHLYAQTSLTEQDHADVRVQLEERASEGALAAFPHHLRDELRFPYVEGKAFVCAAYADGGWDAVDALYAAPPETSAEILFPERYGEQPREPAPLTDPGGRWESERDDAFGAADLMWLFRNPGGDPDRALDDPRAAAAGWDGGAVRLWTSGPRSVVALAFLQRPGAPPLCDSVTEWYQAAFPDARSGEAAGPEEALVAEGGTQSAVVVCDGEEVRVGIAPNVDLARRTVQRQP